MVLSQNMEFLSHNQKHCFVTQGLTKIFEKVIKIKSSHKLIGEQLITVVLRLDSIQINTRFGINFS
jgi:hypothetical protein